VVLKEVSQHGDLQPLKQLSEELKHGEKEEDLVALVLVEDRQDQPEDVQQEV